MLVVAAILEGKKVLIDGSGPVWSPECTSPDWKVAAAGEPRYQQVCQFCIEWPSTEDSGVSQGNKPFSMRRYLVAKFVPILMKALEKGGCLEKKDGAPPKARGQMLVAAECGIFVIDSDFEVQGPHPYACIGSPRASGCATGVFKATSSLPPEERLAQALKAAAKPEPPDL